MNNFNLPRDSETLYEDIDPNIINQDCPTPPETKFPFNYRRKRLAS